MTKKYVTHEAGHMKEQEKKKQNKTQEQPNEEKLDILSEKNSE